MKSQCRSRCAHKKRVRDYLCQLERIHEFPLFRSQQFCANCKRARTHNFTFWVAYCTPFSHPEKKNLSKYAQWAHVNALYITSLASKQTLVDGSLAFSALALELLLMKHGFNAWGEKYKNLSAGINPASRLEFSTSRLEESLWTRINYSPAAALF